MRAAYFLICPDKKLMIRIGQGNYAEMESFYYSEPDTMKQLRDFFNKTSGHTLKLRHDSGFTPQEMDYTLMELGNVHDGIDSHTRSDLITSFSISSEI